MRKWELLIAARERLHFSQVEAAERVNVGLVTYQRWEAGKTRPQPQHLRQLYVVFGSLLEQTNTGPLSQALPSESGNRLLLEPEEERDEPQAFIATYMTTHLWSLAFMDHATSNDKRCSIRQAIKDFDTMNSINKNYQITRREALCSLATLPMITFGLTSSGKVVPPAQYGNVLAHCSASLEACWELYQSSHTGDTVMAFKTVSTYLPLLKTIAEQASSYRQEALDLATRYALLKTLLGWVVAGPTETTTYAKEAVTLSNSTGDISLQLSALSKLAWAYFYEKKYLLALTTAQQGEALLQQYQHHPSGEQLHLCVQAGIYSTLALMQARNGQSPDVTVGRALEMDPHESFALMTSKRRTLLLEAGWTWCYAGNQAKAMEVLQQRVHAETLLPVIEQSEMGRVETINIMALSSLKIADRDQEQTIHFWLAGIEGARVLQNEQRFNEASTTYELMEVVWPNEARIRDLREYLEHW